MGKMRLDELMDDFKTAFKNDSWFQTEEQKQAFAAAKVVFSQEKDPQKQGQALLKILYQAKLKQVAGDSQVDKLILAVLTTWFIQAKPDRHKIQAVIRDLLDSDWFKATKNDPTLLQIVNDLVVIGAQIAYYHGEGLQVVVTDQEDNVKDEQLLPSRKAQLRSFLGDVSKIIAEKKPTQRGGTNVFSSLEETLEKINSSENNEILDGLSIKSVFQQFFSSTTYKAQEFESYQAFIKKWLANGVKKDQADDVLLGHILQLGVEQVSTKRESAGLGKGYKKFSTQAEKFIAFLSEINQKYELPNASKLQELKEEIAIRQAQLLGEASNLYFMGELLKELLKILSNCAVSRERRESFCRRLLEVGLAKCSFLKNRKLNKTSLSEILKYGIDQTYSYVKIDFGIDFGIDFVTKFLLMFLDLYRKEKIKGFIMHKDFASIWDFCESINFKLKNILFSEERMPFINDLREATKETLKDWLGSFTSIDDYLQYLEAEKASKTNLLGVEYTYYIDRSTRTLFVLNSQQLTGLLKTHADYQKLLKALVVDFLTYENTECIPNSAFVTDQVNVLMQVNREVTVSVLYELKAKYSLTLHHTWRAIETHVLAPDRAARSPLLAALLRLTRISMRRSEQESERENDLFAKVRNALSDETLCRDLVVIDALSDQPTASAFTTASIKLLDTFYASLNVAALADRSAEKQFVANILIVFMALQNPSTEHFKAFIDKLYTLKQTYQFSDTSVDYRFITDILILRAQSLDTVQELKEYSDLLTEIQKKYPFPEGSIEQKLKAAVENNLFSLEYPSVQDSSKAKQPTIAAFKLKVVLNYFYSSEHYLELLDSLRTLRKTYQFSVEKTNKRLLEKLVTKGILSCSRHGGFNVVNYEFQISLRFCAFCEEDPMLLHSAFNLSEKRVNKNYHVLGNLEKSIPLHRQFLSYVMDLDVNRVFELFKEPRESIKERGKVITRIYELLNAKGMPECMRSDFLKTYFSECENFVDYEKFAEFVLYEIPYEDKEAPELLKQLTAKLTVDRYQALIEGLIKYARREQKPTLKLEDFLLATVEIAESRAPNKKERVQFFEFIKSLNEKFTFSSSDKRRALIDLMKKIAAHQLHEKLSEMEGLGKALGALNLPEDTRGTVDRLNAYDTAHVRLIENVFKYNKGLAGAKAIYHRQIDLIKDKEASQNNNEINLANFDELTKNSEEARIDLKIALRSKKRTYQALINDVNTRADEVKNKLNNDSIAAYKKLEAFLSAKADLKKTESGKRSDLENKRTEIYRSINAIQDRDVTQSGLIKTGIQQQFDLLDEALKKKAQGLDTYQQTIQKLSSEIDALKTQPNLEFKTLSDKITELEREIGSAETALKKSLSEFDTADNALNQAIAWIAKVKEQETLQQKSVEEIQTQGEALLSNANAELNSHSVQFEDYKKQNLKFSFNQLKSLDKDSFEAFFSSEKQLKAALLDIEASLADWKKHVQTTRNAFEIEREKMADALVDPKLSLIKRDDLVKQFATEKDSLDQAMKAFAPKIVQIKTDLNDAQAELARQTGLVINAFDHQMGLREVSAEGLAKDIAAQLAEEKSLQDAVKDDSEKDAWLTKELAFVPNYEVANDVVLGDLAARTHAVGQVIHEAKAVKDVEKRKFLITLKSVQESAKEVFPRLTRYRERLETVWQANYIWWVLADLLLAVFDHGVLSYLPFVRPLKTFSADQKTLADYTQNLMQIEEQCERVQALNDPLAVGTQQQLQRLNKELVDTQSDLKAQMRPFLEAVSEGIIQDKVETQKLSSTPENWLLSEANDLVTSTQTFISCLSDADTGYTQYQNAGINLEKGLKEQLRLRRLADAIETVRVRRVKTEQALEKIQTELTVLSTDRQRFTQQTETERYQEKLKNYRQNAEKGVSVLHVVLQDAELSSEKKLRFVKDLAESHKSCVNQCDDAKQTPLHIAVKQGDVAMVTLLLQKGAKVNVLDVSRLSPLEFALTAHQKEMIALLKKHGAQPHLIDTNALFNKTIKTGNIDGVKLFLAEEKWLGIDLNQTVKNALLHLAAKAGDITFLEKLIDVGADIQSRDDQNHTLLLSMVTGFAAISDEKQKTKALAFIAKLKSYVEDKQEGKNVLQLAILVGHNELVKQLFSQRSYFYKSAYLTEGNLAGDSALHLLCQKGDLDLFKYVVTNTPYIHQKRLFEVKNQQGETLLHAAMNDPVNLYLLEYLIEQDNTLIDQENKAGEKPFETEVGQRTFTRIRNAKDIYPTLYQRLVDKKVEQNYQRQLEAASTRLKRSSIFKEIPMDNAPQTSTQPLDILKLYSTDSTGKRRSRVLDEIENENFPLDKKNPDQNTLLHLAVGKNDLDMAQVIKAQAGRADQVAKWLELLNVPNGQGDSPLDLAIKLGHVELVRWFLADRGDFLLSQDGQGNAIWQIAFDLKNAQMLAVMLETVLPSLHAFMEEALKKIDFDQQGSETDFWFKIIETKLLGKKAFVYLLSLTDKHEQSLGRALLTRAMKTKDTTLIHTLFAQHQYDEEIMHALVGSYDFSDKSFKAFWIDTIEATPKDKRHWLINAKDRHGNTLLHHAVKDLSLEESGENDLPKVEIPGSVGWCLRNGAVQETEFEVDALTLFYAEINGVFQYKTKEKLVSFVQTFCMKFNLPEDAIGKALVACQKCLNSDTLTKPHQSAVAGILIETCGFDMTLKNTQDKSVLALAREGWEKDTQALLPFQNNDKRTIYVMLIMQILHVLSSTQALQNEMQRQAQKDQKKPTSFKTEPGDTSLHRLVKLNWLNEKNWRETLWGNIPGMLDVSNENGRTPLHIAVLKGDVEQVKFLLAKQAELNKPMMMDMKDRAGQTVLHLLANGKVKGEDEAILAITQLLLKQGADVNVADANGQTPLHRLAARQDALGFELFKQVLAHGANVNAVDHDGETVLHRLAQRTDDTALVMAKLIKDTGKAKTNIQSKHDWTAPGIAWKEENKAFLEIFPLSAKEAINAKVIELKDVVKGVLDHITKAPEPMDAVHPPIFNTVSEKAKEKIVDIPEPQDSQVGTKKVKN